MINVCLKNSLSVLFPLALVLSVLPAHGAEFTTPADLAETVGVLNQKIDFRIQVSLKTSLFGGQYECIGCKSGFAPHQLTRWPGGALKAIRDQVRQLRASVGVSNDQDLATQLTSLKITSVEINVENAMDFPDSKNSSSVESGMSGNPNHPKGLIVSTVIGHDKSAPAFVKAEDLKNKMIEGYLRQTINLSTYSSRVVLEDAVRNAQSRFTNASAKLGDVKKTLNTTMDMAKREETLRDENFLEGAKQSARYDLQKAQNELQTLISYVQQETDSANAALASARISITPTEVQALLDASYAYRTAYRPYRGTIGSKPSRSMKGRTNSQWQGKRY